MTVLSRPFHSSVLMMAVAGAASFANCAGASEFRSRNELDLGFTDNAYLTKDNRKSDAFLAASTSNTWRVGEHEPQLRLSYKDYIAESPNDVLGWRAGDTFKAADWSLTGALVGQLYTGGSPGSTDNSYDNVGLDLRAEKEEDWGSKLMVILAAGYRMRSYTSFSDGRIDHNPFGGFAVEKKMNERLLLSAVSELGLVLSSSSDYSRLYYELGGLADYDLGARWTWTTDLTIGQSFFFNRTISTPVDRLSRRGVRVTGTATSREAYNNIYLTTGALRRQTDRLKWGGEISASNQSSRSGLQDYAAITLMGRGIWIF